MKETTTFEGDEQIRRIVQGVMDAEVIPAIKRAAMKLGELNISLEIELSVTGATEMTYTDGEAGEKETIQ